MHGASRNHRIGRISYDFGLATQSLDGLSISQSLFHRLGVGTALARAQRDLMASKPCALLRLIMIAFAGTVEAPYY